MRKTMRQVRQGDVLVQQIARIPEGAQPKTHDRGRAVLAYGEVTGHAHALDGALADLFEEKDGSLYLRVTGATPLVHEEHDAIPFEVSDNVVIHQEEYTPAEIRRVVD